MIGEEGNRWILLPSLSSQNHHLLGKWTRHDSCCCFSFIIGDWNLVKIQTTSIQKVMSGKRNVVGFGDLLPKFCILDSLLWVLHTGKWGFYAASFSLQLLLCFLVLGLGDWHATRIEKCASLKTLLRNTYYLFKNGSKYPFHSIFVKVLLYVDFFLSEYRNYFIAW